MLTPAEIKFFIDEDKTSKLKQQAREGQRYYEADHDILKYRMFYYNADGELVEDRARANSRICHPFFTEHVDQLAAYIMSFEENPIQAREVAEGLQEQLDEYFDDAFWAEIQELITGTNAKGFEYLFGYQNADDRLAFACADSLGVVEVAAKYASDKQDHVLYSYVDHIDRNKKVIKRIHDHTATEVRFYTQEDDGIPQLDDEADLNPRPSIVWRDPKTGLLYGDRLGFIPFWRLDNNIKRTSALHPIKGLIDDYDLMQCGLSNNLQDFDHPIYLAKGWGGDDLNELGQNIRTKKMMGLGADDDLEIKTINIPYEARKVKADEDEKNIYKFGMAFNSVQMGDGNITNVVIRSRYTLLDLKAGKLITRLKRFLKPIIETVLAEINEKNSTDYKYSDVLVEFKPIIPTNEQEAAQIALTEAQTEQTKITSILNVAALIGDEAALRAICEQLDLDYDDIEEQLEAQSDTQDLDAAMATLGGITVNEPPTEAGAGTVPA